MTKCHASVVDSWFLTATICKLVLFQSKVLTALIFCYSMKEHLAYVQSVGAGIKILFIHLHKWTPNDYYLNFKYMPICVE